MQNGNYQYTLELLICNKTDEFIIILNVTIYQVFLEILEYFSKKFTIQCLYASGGLIFYFRLDKIPKP